MNAATTEILVRDNLPLVGHLVRELLFKVPPHIQRDDLAAAGHTALAAAAGTFDPARHGAFGRYAAARVRNALLEVVNGTADPARRAGDARHDLTARLTGTTDGDLAALLGLGVRELAPTSGDAQRDGIADMVTRTAVNPQETQEHRDRIGHLTGAVAQLPEPLRHIVEASFLREQPLDDVAAGLGITGTQAAQLRTEALTLLKNDLATHAAQRPTGPTLNGRALRNRAAYTAQPAADLTALLVAA